MVRALEAAAVSPAHRDAGGIQMTQQAAVDAAAHSPVHAQGLGPEILHPAVKDLDIPAFFDLERPSPAFAEAQSPYGHVLAVLQGQHILGAEDGESGLRVLGVYVFRHIPVQAAVVAVEVPFAGGVDLAEQVQPEEAQAVAKALAREFHHPPL